MKRRYFLSLAALGLSGCAPALRQTPASTPDGVLRKIGFGSCIDQTKPQPIWATVMADRPDLFIFGGDNVYSSSQPWSAARLTQAYQQQAEVPGFARFRSSVPQLAIWDDHDYGLNDGGAEFAHKQASKAQFLRFWEAPADDPRRTRDGIYHAKVFGPVGRRVQVILLDTRWFRSALKPTDERGKTGKERYLPDADPSKTMLGEVQWRWFEAQLRIPAELRLVVSGVQVLATGHGWEGWGTFPLERERLYKLVASTGAAGVVFMSGDRHFGALYREASAAPYPFYELTSSGITHPWIDASEAGPNRLGELIRERHYGSVEVDWEARALRLLIKGGEGAVVHGHSISFNELKVPS